MSDPAGATRDERASGAFDAERPLLVGLAYRMLGSLDDAEDVVQEAWLRWSAADRSTVRNPAAWLTTVTARLAIDRTRALARRRERYVGPWLPDPVATEPGPDEQVQLAESLTLGFLVVLDALAPRERAVFLLADVFAVPFAEIAGVVGKSEAACRQIAVRARRKVHDARAGTSPADAALLEQLVGAFVAGDVEGVLRLVDPEVEFVSDSGPSRRAARRRVRGADRVLRLVAHQVRQLGPVPVSSLRVNNAAALVLQPPDGPIVLQADQRGGRVVVIRALMNPDRLEGLVPSPRVR